MQPLVGRIPGSRESLASLPRIFSMAGIWIQSLSMEDGTRMAVGIGSTGPMGFVVWIDGTGLWTPAGAGAGIPEGSGRDARARVGADIEKNRRD